MSELDAADGPTVLVGSNAIGLALRAICDKHTFDEHKPIQDALRTFDELLVARHPEHDVRRDQRAQLCVPKDVSSCFASVRLQKRDKGCRLNKMIANAPPIVREWCEKQARKPWRYFYVLQAMGRPCMKRVQRVPQATTGNKVREGQVKHAKPRHVLDSYAPLGAWVEPSSHDEVDRARSEAREVMREARKRTAFDTFDKPQYSGEPTILRPRKK